MPDGGEAYDGVDAAASDAYDVMDDEGWRHWHDDDGEADAAVHIHAGHDDAEEPLDTSAYFFEAEDDDAELRQLLEDLEEEFGAKGDEASRSILASVRSCEDLLNAEQNADMSLDARAALAFAATARGEAPVDVDRDTAGDLVAVDDELADAFALLDGEVLDEHLDEMYGWLVGNASRGSDYGRSSTKTRTIGLDLGTTNSAAAAVDDSGAPKLLPPGLIPSVVAFLDGDVADIDASGRIALRDDDGRGVVAVVGAEAEAYRSTPHAQSVCSRVKRVLARDATLSERRRTSAAADPEKRGGTTLLRVPALPSRIAAAEVSAEVVRCLREKAAEALGGAVDRCVVGVPARFDEDAREATKTAASLGGFADVELLDEPVAAALAYGASRARRGEAEGETVLVFDLGGGTLDVCVVDMRARDRARVVAVGGDAKLGGDDFDAALAEHLGDRFFDDHGVAVRAPTARLRLLGLAERAKIDLSRANETVAAARGLARVAADGVTRQRGGKPLDLDAVVTRRLYEALCRPLLLRLEACVSATCLEAGVALPGGWTTAALEEDGPRSTRALDRVLLVGGSTRMPAVGRMLRRLTGLPLSKIAANEDVHPDEAVALGCAVRAATLDREAPLVEAPRELAA